MKFRAMIGTVLLALLLFASACGGGRAGGAQPGTGLAEVPGQPVLPQPLEIVSRSSSAAFPWFSLASDFVPGETVRTLPGFGFGQRIFQPDYPGDGPAWAMHAIDVTGFAGTEELTLDWAEAPLEGQLFIGIANFATNRWEWTAPADVSLLGVSVDADHTSPAKRFYVAVLMTGTDEAILNWLRLGGNIPPVVELSASVPSGFDSLVTDLVAAAEDPEGSPITFEFDVEGDGSFIAGGSATLEDVLYNSPGAFHPAVRVTDGDGGVSVASTLVGVGWLHSFGEAGYEEAGAVATGSSGQAYLTGLANSWGEGANETGLISYSPTGSVGLARTIGIANGDSGTEVAVGSSGAILISGYHINMDFDDFAHACYLTPAGTIGWQKTWASGTFAQAQSCFLDDSDNAYIGSVVNVGGAYQMHLMKLDSSGSVTWQKLFTLAEDVDKMVIRPAPDGGIILACNVYAGTGNNWDVLVARLDSSADVLWCQTLVTGGKFELGGMHATAGEIMVVGSLNEFDDPVKGSLLLRCTMEGGLIQQYRMDCGGLQGWYDITTDPATGAILVCGTISNQDAGDMSLCGVVASLTPDGVLDSIQCWNNSLQNNDFAGISALADGGYYVCGRGVNATGTWYEPSYAEFADGFAWNSYTCTSADASLVVTDFTAVMSDISAPAPVIDTGGGSSDIIIMRWFAP